ncbi:MULTISPECIES: hypothetical protein [Paenibacillus]|uniref:Beta-carotene 15,15'-monooxygenase n=1 Tax=Paenibacillus lautus TaxID=1401 RepID=A0A1R1AU26_PAELA|nr:MULTISPECIES: hypothetical protein [Paenibacillus]MBT2761531.1 hypothetical protein [Paenibacillus sp. ISL-20]OME89063.1 hypothetical protein BK123_27180 [Paenibacillus lautus]
MKKTFRLLFKNPLIIMYPIILDALSFIIGLIIVGFIGVPSLSIRLILEMGIPSVSYVSNIPQLINQMQFMGDTISVRAWIPVIFMLLLMAFAQGGYIASLRNVVEGSPISIGQFMKDGKKYAVRFIFLFMIITAAKTAITTLLAAFLGVIGLFLSLVIFVVLRVIFIYVEYCIVVNQLNVDAAFRQSRRYFQASSFNTSGIIIVMMISSGVISLLLHYLWSPAAVIIAIPICAVVMGVIQIAFMQQLLLNKAST